MKKYQCTNYKRFLTAVSILLFTVILTAQLYKPEKTAAFEPLNIVVATVQEGDSFWKLAERYDNNKIDLREYISLIQTFNTLDSDVLQPGQKIRIPIY